jgi:uncharacterized membrane protein YbhN (UPF0104 family)
MPTSRGLPQDLMKEDNCFWSGRKQPANASMRRSHRAQPTADECPNGPTVGETTAAQETEADLTLGGRATRWRRARALAALATVVPVVAGLMALRDGRLRARLESVVARCLRLAQRLIHRPHGDARALIDAAEARVAGLRLKRRGWAFVFFMATLNWVSNIACLALALLAVRSPVPWSRLILAWSAGVGASSFGITPGGLGLVEAVLAGALIAAGVHTPQAVAAVLLYRLISFWLVDALGWTFYVTTRKQRPPPPPVSDSSVDLNP